MLFAYPHKILRKYYDSSLVRNAWYCQKGNQSIEFNKANTGCWQFLDSHLVTAIKKEQLQIRYYLSDKKVNLKKLIYWTSPWMLGISAS